MTTQVLATLRQAREATGQALDRYRDVLATHDPRLLLGAGVVSVVGDWFNTVALLVLANRIGEGPLGVGGLLAVRVLPGVLLQGPAGALVDRLPGRRLLVTVELLMAAVAASFVVLNAVPNLWLLYALAFALEGLNTIARPAFLVQFTGAVPPERRASANGLLWMGWTVAQALGTLLGGLLLTPLGATPLFLLNALTFVAIAFAVTRVRGDASVEPVTASDHAAGDGAHAEARTPGYRALFRLDVVAFAAITLSASLLIRAAGALFVVRGEELGLGEGGVGPLLAAVAVGLFLGGALAGAGSHTGRQTLYLVAAAEAAAAAGLAVFGVAGGPTVALVALALTGFTSEVAEVAGLTYFQHRLPSAFYGRFFSVILMAAALGGAGGALLGPLLEQEVGAGRALVALAIPGIGLAIAFGVGARARPASNRPTHRGTAATSSGWD